MFSIEQIRIMEDLIEFKVNPSQYFKHSIWRLLKLIKLNKGICYKKVYYISIEKIFDLLWYYQ